MDASALLSALLRDGPARRAVGDEQVHAPHLIDAEVVNALRRRAAAGQITPGDGAALVAVVRGLGMIRHPTFPALPRLWELRSNLSAYDAAYVALAEDLGCALLTADARLSRAPGLACPVTVVPR